MTYSQIYLYGDVEKGIVGYRLSILKKVPAEVIYKKRDQRKALAHGAQRRECHFPRKGSNIWEANNHVM
jgi:hypothetical protein